MIFSTLHLHSKAAFRVFFLLHLFVCSINSVSVGCLAFGMLPSCVAFSDSLNSLIYFRVKF